MQLVASLGVVAVLLAAPAAGPQAKRPAGAEMKVSRHDAQISASGDHFRLTVDGARGGEITNLELFDGLAWNRLLGGDGQTCPQVRIQGDGGEYELSRDRAARVLEYDARPERLRFRVAAVPQGKDGRKAPWEVVLGYEVYPEGAVFVDLQYQCSQDDFSLTGAGIGFAVDRGLTKAAKYREELFTGRTVALPSARIAFGLDAQKSFTNEIQVILEAKKAMAGEPSGTLPAPGPA